MLITTSPLAAVLLFCNSEKLIYSYGINGQLIQRVVEKEAAYFLSPIIMKDINSFEYVAYGNERGEVIMRSLPFLENMKRFTVAKDACVNRVSISRNGRYLVAGCSDGEVSVITDPNLPR